MKVVAIIQARMTSERLPGKVLMPLNGIPVIKRIVDRVKMSKNVSEVTVATSDENADDVLYEFCHTDNIDVFRGDLQNVLKRFYDCAKEKQAEIIVRLTGDNALVDPDIIDQAIEIYKSNNTIDYLRYFKGLPLGMAVEVFSYSALERAYKEADNKECQEHVTLYMYRCPEKFHCLIYEDSDLEDYSHLRWTIDTFEDYKLVNNIFKWFNNNKFHYQDVLQAYVENVEWEDINVSIQQKETIFRLNK